MESKVISSQAIVAISYQHPDYTIWLDVGLAG